MEVCENLDSYENVRTLLLLCDFANILWKFKSLACTFKPAQSGWLSNVIITIYVTKSKKKQTNTKLLCKKLIKYKT